MPEGLSPQQFVAKWSRVELPERAASQEHFIDLCRMLGQPTPAEHDATGAEYTFEKGVTVTGSASRGSRGDAGFADVWWRGKFGWEYKRKGKYRDLNEAYRQLLQYREALENPPLLVVSDIARTEIHTNFTGTIKQVHAIALADLAEPENLANLRRIFTDPDSFRPQITTQRVTEEVAQQIGRIAVGLHDRGHEPHGAAHFLMKSMFCLFAEDVRLLPPGVFKRLLERGRKEPERLTGLLTQLFGAMKTGGDFGADEIAWFNGGLFDDSPALGLTADEIEIMLKAAEQDWGAVEPAIFGTLFERSLDPNKRAQIGAHYTSREDIMLIVEPVVMAPLKREWEAVQTQVQALIERRDKAKTRETKRKHESDIAKAIEAFLDRLAGVKILDPACGSGNFLYVAIQQLLELEKQVITFAARPDIGLGLFPRVRPTQLAGIEINPYAAELAQVVIWIGYLQWMRDNGFIAPKDPILAPLTTVECRDAILAWADEPGQPVPTQREGATCTGPASWPEADFIIGNPPFLGSKLYRDSGVDDTYIASLHSAHDLSRNVDLCCYWFELARRAIAAKASTRAGLLATQGIRGSDNRGVLERIQTNGTVFMAWSDRDWILDGAAVHVSMVGFTSQTDEPRYLDGRLVTEISPALTAGPDTTQARPLVENAGIGFVGACKKGKFELTHERARQILAAAGNPNGRRNSEVLAPWYNGIDVVQRYEGNWIIDFGPEENLSTASQYEAPIEYVRVHVKPERDKVRNSAERRRWWMLARPAPDFRAATAGLSRFVVVPQVAKHRVFSWLSAENRPSHQLTVIARTDEYCFGVLSSALHVLWSLRMGTQLEDRPRYTPSTCFETFPFPWPPGKEPERDPIYQRIAEAAKALNELRERWLNPPEWLEAITARIDAQDDFADVPPEARPLIRHSAVMAAAARDALLKKRTLTNLYNERPTWLRLAHEQLDRAVLAAYAATDSDGGWSQDWAEVWSEIGAGQPLPGSPPLGSLRGEVDERVLSNLLRLNQARSSG